MTLEQKDIDAAKREQDKYWFSLSDNFMFFKDVSRQVPLEIFDLPNYSNFGHYRAKFETAMPDYKWIARYWASNFLEYHIAFTWTQDYNLKKSEGMKEKDASKYADAERVRLTAHYKKMYP